MIYAAVRICDKNLKIRFINGRVCEAVFLVYIPNNSSKMFIKEK